MAARLCITTIIGEAVAPYSEDSRDSVLHHQPRPYCIPQHQVHLSIRYLSFSILYQQKRLLSFPLIVAVTEFQPLNILDQLQHLAQCGDCYALSCSMPLLAPVEHRLHSQGCLHARAGGICQPQKR
jgi:hypothetical protein